MKNKTLIHSALLCECQCVINFFKLKQDKSCSAFKLYHNEKIVLVVSGIGKENTINALRFAFDNFIISKAINIGIAGCKDQSIDIGTLFTTNKKIKNLNFTTLTTIDKPLDNKLNLKTTLVDMEAFYFEEYCKQYCENIIVLKVVSDYLDTNIPKKSFIIDLMQNNFNQWKSLI
ncbi:nucleoside phosphorylase [Arcobacter sp. CECT 8985]|uniref:nucleoside phosphorylase n=1 Tax=Arcobacter sp. CECT 8985 TaxID=1935424 RepID=UPI00100B26EE|nr:nucleoside phosphorylase [Arcobacter sp. CECT 8985]RXJ87474.1 nucleoside phosphorylase [Arcobacter sp. CECT 8985]